MDNFLPRHSWNIKNIEVNNNVANGTEGTAGFLPPLLVKKSHPSYKRNDRASFTAYPDSAQAKASPRGTPGIPSTVELQVTNLDQQLDHHETKRMINNLFRYKLLI